MRQPPPIDRVSADDLMSLVAERGSIPMQWGAVLVLDAAAGLDPRRAIEELDRRVATVPRLRQRLRAVPIGCGRPIWVDDPGFAIGRHVRVVELPGPSLPERAILQIAADLLTVPLPRDRPLWAARLVTSATRREAALIVVVHHVVADGVAGLAVLGRLVDGPAGRKTSGATPAGSGADGPGPAGSARPDPTPRQIAADVVRERLGSLRQLPRSLLRLAAAARQLRAAPTRLARTSLNVPTGPRRELASIRVPVAEVRAAARASGATVNDVLLVAIAAALRRLLATRGEQLDAVVVSVPFSARQQTSAAQLGNQSGVIPLRIPAVGDPAARLRRVAALTRTAKRGARGASTALIAPLFRVLARLGLYRWFIDRQRLIHTFVSNVIGPPAALMFLGCPVTALLPLSAPTGNVTVAFAVLSASGTLAITLAADPDACPDLDVLRDALADELALLDIAEAPNRRS